MLASYEHENMQRNAQEIVAFLPLTTVIGGGQKGIARMELASMTGVTGRRHSVKLVRADQLNIYIVLASLVFGEVANTHSGCGHSMP